MRTGLVGNTYNMSVYKSNNVPNTSGEKYKIIAGKKSIISFTGQVDGEILVKKKKVCAYCRVTTSNEEQLESYKRAGSLAHRI